MSKPKMSARERQQQGKFLRFAAIGLTIPIAIVGSIFLLTAGSEMPRLEGQATLAERLDDANLTKSAFRLTGTGEPDIVIVGSSDCVHCQRFTSEAMPAFVEAMAADNLTIDYLPLPTGPGSIVSSRALSCLAGGEDTVASVQATYALSSEITQGLTPEEVPERLQTIAQELDLPGDPTACWNTTTVEDTIARGTVVSQALNLQGTPGFYVRTDSDPTTVRQFNGFNSLESLLRQVGAARDS